MSGLILDVSIDWGRKENNQKSTEVSRKRSSDGRPVQQNDESLHIPEDMMQSPYKPPAIYDGSHLSVFCRFGLGVPPPTSITVTAKGPDGTKLIFSLHAESIYPGDIAHR